MRGLGRPDFTVLKPVKYVHRNYPWREGNGDFEQATRRCFRGIRHPQTLA